MFDFISFGSGSSGNCYYIETSEGAFLIDLGLSRRKLKNYLRAYDIPLPRIKALFVTHDHSDHAKSAGVFANDQRLPIHLTTKVLDGIRRSPVIAVKPDETLIRLIEPETPIDCCGCRITPFLVPHDSTGNVGYSVCYGDTVFCLITDAGHITDGMKRYISQAHHLVIEANYDKAMLAGGKYPAFMKRRIAASTGHLSNCETAEVVAENRNRRLQNVWLCHLSEENNHPELARKTVEAYWAEHIDPLEAKIRLHVLKRTLPSERFALENQTCMI